MEQLAVSPDDDRVGAEVYGDVKGSRKNLTSDDRIQPSLPFGRTGR
jgi:hypothetical protein